MARLFAIAGAILLAAALLLWRAAPAADLALLLALRAPADAAAIGRFTDLGGATVELPVALVAAALLGWRGERRRALTLVAAVIAGRIVIEGAKAAIARPRPPLALHLASVESLSMPSSHTAGTAFTCLLVAGAFGGGWRVAVAMVFAAAIGFSRMALGVHFPSDVLAGWGAGLLWAALWWRAVAK